MRASVEWKTKTTGLDLKSQTQPVCSLKQSHDVKTLKRCHFQWQHNFPAQHTVLLSYDPKHNPLQAAIPGCPHLHTVLLVSQDVSLLFSEKQY